MSNFIHFMRQKYKEEYRLRNLEATPSLQAGLHMVEKTKVSILLRSHLLVFDHWFGYNLVALYNFNSNV